MYSICAFTLSTASPPMSTTLFPYTTLFRSIWCARTLASDPDWRYLNVRRVFNYVRSSILIGTQWAVFEPNNMALWLKLQRDVASFLSRLYATGALFGATERQAFYVKCDGETNPPKVVDAGQVVVEIGIAPTKPAEFVTFGI